jgi:hypothetical protein
MTTDKMTEIDQYFFELCTANANAWGIQEVLDAPYQLIGATPAISLEPTQLDRGFAGAAGIGTMRAMDDFRYMIHIHHCRLQDAGTNHRQNMERAELIVDKIHEDKQLGGLVVEGWIARQEYGITRAINSLMWATRLTWTGRSLVIV